MAADGLKKWFSRNNGKGWVDCKASKAAGKAVPCGRKSAGSRRGTGYPACRPTVSACTKAGMRRKKSRKRVSWKES
tara:strand:+ start:646 stop:873 length:228 start_codon:yes stop_codon:yes gene_type:complete